MNGESSRSFEKYTTDENFIPRHLGPRANEIEQMLKALGFSQMEDLIRATVPHSIRLNRELNIPVLGNESQAQCLLQNTLSKNQLFRNYIGMGYSSCLVPPVIQRNIFENPGWYTQYTPYQAEISQGRLEALLNFQTLVSDLTGLPISNASLLDEGTAVAEAMTLAWHQKGSEEKNQFFISSNCHPQTLEVARTRAEVLDIQVVVGDHKTFGFGPNCFGAVISYPGTLGEIEDLQPYIEKIHKADGLGIIVADLLALTLLRSPGEMGADMAVGSSQRFGVPLGYGGPHAAYFATKEEFKRQIPGRIIGVSVDSRGKPALRLSLQTREQHIRREKATSNICTAQVLLAIMASMYAVYHGPKGLRAIAQRVHGLTASLAARLQQGGWQVSSTSFFDTLTVSGPQEKLDQVLQKALSKKMNLRRDLKGALGISLDETTHESDVANLCEIFTGTKPQIADLQKDALSASKLPDTLKRTSPYLTHAVFNSFHSETEMLRYITRLQVRDLSLTSSMIPLGSCTMKLNAAAEMYPVSWPWTAQIHPFAPADQALGYKEMIQQLEGWLCEVTGFSAVSFQPNAGSQGEYAGLLTIRRYHQSRKDMDRKICLIPTSAHGTNPASAVMAGMKVIAVKCDERGNIDVADLKQKAAEHSAHLSCLMVTYPSTHGVFEESIREICDVIHQHGGQVYMDGANLNAQIGICRPADIGADVCHMNLHKTFCIPHGGGGPGVGPIGVKSHLQKFLPGHGVVSLGSPEAVGAVSAAPWGSASILPISWMYIAMMGGKGLRQSAEVAILNANYIAHRLKKYYPTVYSGREGMVAHECIVDIRPLQATTGVTVEDVAKRLMDYGFHAPTMSWPVAGTLMIEPTESESKAELDRLCDAMISIYEEIQEIANGKADKQVNLLKMAPHTADVLTADKWDRPYSRERAAFPSPHSRIHKFWPFVGRVDNAYGDRNLVCACPPWGDDAKG